mmetsp:Transcript_26737/g.77839  ORF Transcript_26737/g.77839 Transcript_26737/m.77839 type:complete len:374 (-) Transcript_26737:605-1726(-)
MVRHLDPDLPVVDARAEADGAKDDTAVVPPVAVAARRCSAIFGHGDTRGAAVPVEREEPVFAEAGPAGHGDGVAVEDHVFGISAVQTSLRDTEAPHWRSLVVAVAGRGHSDPELEDCSGLPGVRSEPRCPVAVSRPGEELLFPNDHGAIGPPVPPHPSRGQKVGPLEGAFKRLDALRVRCMGPEPKEDAKVVVLGESVLGCDVQLRLGRGKGLDDIKLIVELNLHHVVLPPSAPPHDLVLQGLQPAHSAPRAGDTAQGDDLLHDADLSGCRGRRGRRRLAAIAPRHLSLLPFSPSARGGRGWVPNPAHDVAPRHEGKDLFMALRATHLPVRRPARAGADQIRGRVRLGHDPTPELPASRAIAEHHAVLELPHR